MVVVAARLARAGGADPTNGAMHFNFRNSDWAGKFMSMSVQTQVGPLTNSYTKEGLNPTGVSANTYK
jgi:hypothetical protein